MIPRSFVGGIAAALLLLLAGCSSGPDPFVGTYNGKTSFSAAEKKQIDALSPDDKAKAEKTASQQTILRLSQDGTFSLTSSIQGSYGGVVGTWTHAGDLITLVPREDPDDPDPNADHSMQLTVNSGGKILTLLSAKTGNIPVGTTTFSRSG